MNRTQKEQDEIRDWAADLNRQVELGEIRPVPGAKVYRGEHAEAMTGDDLLAIFEGRPREEHLNTSALIRKAVAEYLGRHHFSARPA
ncbi:hypothetical protein GA0061078_1574 [Bifidobacterium bohemicum]|uniref:Uncharacterized protein n=1 Tax=Bifidobacterium bohemicum DSM 22767 TaxID=1437606 RepID=A0A086ZHH5_9BIFI|nr:hypothetical protein [Bifidobacterium bohemicum]KFI45975.1 hypothetical protein BBOH_0782 [Bifidobacterium bohemicum DSM 22767]SCC13664.1 hypothetical protein GA0061078_1574 [Bifidobacterium bohemicum]